jgi:hypothetical protein
VASRLAFLINEKTYLWIHPRLKLRVARLKTSFKIYRVMAYLRRASVIHGNWGTSCNESEEQAKKNVVRREELHDRIR